MVNSATSKRWSRASLLIGLALGLLLPTIVHAGVDDITAVATPVRLEVGESFVYRVTVTGTGSLPMPTVNLPSMFQIIAGPNSNMNMQIVNGRMSTERILTYRLRALRQGEHVIPAPEVRVRGKAKTGNPVTILVSSPGNTTSPGVGSGSSSQPSTPDQGSSTPRDKGPVDSPAEDAPIFLHVEASTVNATLQEPIVVTWTLYFRPSVRTYDVRRLASTEGFWSEQWDVPNPPDVYQREINGVTYNVALIHRLILFPSRSGKLTIGPMEVVVQYEGARNRGLLDDFFDDSFFGGGLREKELTSNPLTVNVKPLPQKGMPENFNEMVGDYRIDATLEPQSASVNESVVLTVTISGEGNIGFIPAPDVNVPLDLERYEPEVSVEKAPDSGDLTGKKSFRYLLIPRRAGDQAIDPISISYFDPDKNRYQTRSTKPLTLHVTPGTIMPGLDETQNGGAPARVETVGQDIRWILDASRGLRQSGKPITEHVGYWLAYLIPLGVAGVGLGLRQLRDSQRGREGEIRSRKAAGRARAALKQARDHLAADEIEQGYTALSRGMISYLADRLSISAGELDPSRRREVLSERKIEEKTRTVLEEILEKCNTARFTPQGADSHALEDLISRANEWIGAVDKRLSR